MFEPPNKAKRIFILLILAAYVWLFFNLWFPPTAEIMGGIPSVCFIKQITGYPCPSCGTTRAVLAILHGEWLNGLLLNPFAYIVLPFMAIIPLWIAFDHLNKSNTLEVIYRQTERCISKTKTAIVLLLLLLANWVWNFYKGY
ncbi:MAG: DUF2752 domain-containing protein [bacterium]|nr:DUF2752 domain-containing protein [bacterium]